VRAEEADYLSRRQRDGVAPDGHRHHRTGRLAVEQHCHVGGQRGKADQRCRVGHNVDCRRAQRREPGPGDVHGEARDAGKMQRQEGQNAATMNDSGPPALAPKGQARVEVTFYR
jgi:hypothetical protein